MSNSKRDRVPLSAIVGRDALAQQAWQMLEEKSIVLTAERRMGKTYLLYKLQGEAEQQQQNWVQGWLCLYQDLSGCSSPLEFVQSVFDTAQHLLGRRNKVAEQTRRLLSRFQELKVGPIQLPKSAIPEWKGILRSIFADLSEQLADDRVVFMWDEFPVMLDEITKQEGGTKIAGEILNLLHTLRAEYPRVRMILTGSVGLHHILNKLRQGGFNNPVNNDMNVLSVTPLEKDFAIGFARSLLESSNINCQDIATTATTIAQEVDNIPFYIDGVVKRFRYHPQAVPLSIDVEMIQQEVRSLLVDADNTLQMQNYLDRIENYYGKIDSELVRQILDVMADEEQPIATKDIIKIINNASSPPIAEQLIRDLLKLLEQDHYLIKDPIDLKYTFRYSLIRRYWQCQRG
jgi:AAA+ ATPase superfamily predicted ATPase